MESSSDELSKDDFQRSGWETVIAACDKKQCAYYSSAFHAKAREAESSGNTIAQRVLDLLGSISSLDYKPDSPEEPFRPRIVIHDRRTPIVDDFSDGQLKLLGEIVNDINDPELRARIADVLWLRKRDYRMGELAISAYLESARSLQDPEHWVATAEHVERALQLATILNSRLFTSVTDYIEGVLDTYKGEDPLFLSARMMSFLQERRAGDHAKYATLAGEIASRAESAHDWDRAREYWSIKAKWHLIGKDETQARHTRLAEAETYVKQALDHTSGNPPGYSLAAAFLQHAIEAFRRVGNAKERVDELHKSLLEYQRLSVSELAPISSEVDITEIVHRAREQVKGKSLTDALLALAMMGSVPSVDRLRAQAQENRKRFVLQSLLPRVYLNAMGRVIARHPQDPEESLLADMYHDATMSRGIHVQAIVEPARRQIASEHHVRVADFLPLLSNHPFIPAGREMIVARGLHAGLHGDFLSSTHFLIPQLEEAVRAILFHLGVITSGLDDQGIQDEFNLNKMLSASEYSGPLGQFLGEDFVFDMRGLLVERFGANLRNDMAHGLIDHDSFYSASGCYVWWLALRLYSLPVLARLNRQGQPSDDKTGDAAHTDEEASTSQDDGDRAEAGGRAEQESK